MNIRINSGIRISFTRIALRKDKTRSKDLTIMLKFLMILRKNWNRSRKLCHS